MFPSRLFLKGLVDFKFRKYNPETGLFTQPDTLIPNVYNPQSLNRYSFEENNPYNRIDPDGHAATFILGLLFIGAAIIGGYKLSEKLVELETEQGYLTTTDKILALLNVVGIVFPAKGPTQIGLKKAGDFGYKGYFNRRIEETKARNQNSMSLHPDYTPNVDYTPAYTYTPYIHQMSCQIDESKNVQPEGGGSNGGSSSGGSSDSSSDDSGGSCGWCGCYASCLPPPSSCDPSSQSCVQ